MKKASMVVFRRMTAADFFHTSKKPGVEEGGGGQSYIDIASKVSLKDWHEFFAGVKPEKKTKGRPLWTVEINSLSLGKAQRVKIGQRRGSGSAVSIRSQKLESRASNRVLAWHPEKTGFPKPKGSLADSKDPKIPALIEGLVVYIIRAIDGSYWAGWLKTQNRKTKNWVVKPDLESMFSDKSGLIKLSAPISFDEQSLHWPFRDHPEFKDVETSEEAAADALFELDYSSGPAPFSASVTKTRKRNRKAAKTLKNLYGECQITGSEYVFSKKNGEPYLEVHHLVPLGLDGADAPSNLIVVSAHMHRMLHYADISEINLAEISDNKLKITVNGKSYCIRWHKDHAAKIKKS